MDCKCDFRTKIVGDGCEVCNPAKALEYAKETISDLEDELEANEQDAKRYRWLRDNGGFQEGRKSRGVTIAKDELKSLMSFAYWVTSEELDAAIDSKSNGSV